MKICSKCGSKNPGVHDFCTKCGASLRKEGKKAEKRAQPVTLLIGTQKIMGAILLIVGIVLLVYCFETARNLIGMTLSHEEVFMNLIWLVIMVGIAIFLTSKGIRLVRWVTS